MGKLVIPIKTLQTRSLYQPVRGNANTESGTMLQQSFLESPKPLSLGCGLWPHISSSKIHVILHTYRVDFASLVIFGCH